MDDKEVIFLKVEPELKTKLKELARVERRSLTSIILPLIEKRLNEVENATATAK